MSELAGEISVAIRSAAGGREPTAGSIFNKPGDEYVAYGLKALDLRAALRPFRDRVRELAPVERLKLAGELLVEGVGEAGHAGIWVVAVGERELSPRDFSALDRLVDSFQGWSHVDDFCASVLQPLLIRFPGEVVALLDGWTRSPNRWKRRSSVVAFTRKVGESGVYTDTVLELCERLVGDPEDLVLKGVGWALKDNLRGAPERVTEYVKELRRRGVSSVVTLYAIRDLDGARRAEVLAVNAAGKSG